MTSRDEPFDGLFTQGMVCHETYRAADGTWLLPEEVERVDGKVVRLSDRSPVEVGRSEKMSKSKKNVVDPTQIIHDNGADTARLFMLSDSPPERDLEWTEAGVDGAWRYLNRLWRLVGEPPAPLPPPGTARPAQLSPEAEAAWRAAHKAIAAVSEHLEAFRFNVAVAQVRTLSNALAELGGTGAGEAWALRFGLETLTLLIGPMTPHLAEAMWVTLDREGLLCEQPWPKADPALLVEDRVTVAVQVNGKLRATIDLPRNAANDDAQSAALAHPAVQRSLDGKAPRKVIVVPNRIVNVVA
jgi:leucyl-tRNA synthetase